jgi:hypothetical protein
MTTLEILKAARAKIADKKNWTQGELGRDANGNPVTDASLLASQAVCFCASGALFLAGASEDGIDVWHVLSRSMGCFVPKFNDSHTHAEVLAAFDKAIAELEVQNG